jgi:hypothetical protein
MRLTWKFEWTAKRASAVSDHGTYLVIGERDDRWSGRFIPATGDGAPFPGAGRDPFATVRFFPSLADAVSSCQRHYGECAAADPSGRYADPLNR